jgi:outer membrane protein assembly factor BamB
MAVLRTRQGAVAVTVADGRVRWRRDDLGRLRSLDHGSPGSEADSTLARTSTVTAAVADHTAYVPGRDELLALDARDGSVRWRVPVAGVAATPAVADGTVVAAGGTELVAVALDGTVRWRSPARGRRGSPAVADGVVYAPGDGLVALNLADGTERWVRPPAATPSPDCAVLGDTVVVHDDGLSGVARRPDRDGLLAGYRRWQSDVQTAGYSPAAVGAERLVAVEPFDGRVVAFG